MLGGVERKMLKKGGGGGGGGGGGRCTGVVERDFFSRGIFCSRGKFHSGAEIPGEVRL